MPRWIIITCLLGCGGLTSTPEGDGGPPPVFPTGIYACESTLDVAGTYDGEKFDAVAGGSGTLDVTQAGAVVTAVYTTDTFLSGTLSFDVTTGAAAAPLDGQSMTMSCFSPFGQTPPQPLSISSGSLTVDGNTLFLSFVGTAQPGGAPGACDGDQVPGTLTCTSQP